MFEVLRCRGEAGLGIDDIVPGAEMMIVNIDHVRWLNDCRGALIDRLPCLPP